MYARAARLSPLPAFVVEEDVHDQREPSADGGEKKQDGQSGVTPDAEAGFDPHEHRRADDQRRKDQPHGDAVGNILKPFDERVLVDGIDTDLELVVRDRVEDFIDPRRQTLEQIFYFEDAAEEVAGGKSPNEALLHDRGGVPADRGVRVEVGRDGAADLVAEL